MSSSTAAAFNIGSFPGGGIIRRSRLNAKTNVVLGRFDEIPGRVSSLLHF